MKKLLVLTALVLFLSSLIALESDPSDVVGFVKYALQNNANGGSNFISYAMDKGLATAQDLAADIGTECDGVSYWDAAGQSWVTVNKLPFGWSGNFNITYGYAYMVHVTSSVDYYIAGDLGTQPTFNLVNNANGGSNAIMVRLDKSSLATAQDLAADIGTECEGVSYWDASAQSWVSINKLPFGWSSNFNIEIGEALIVYVTGNVTWPSSRTLSVQKKVKNVIK